MLQAAVDAKTKAITDKEGEKGATEASLVEVVCLGLRGVPCRTAACEAKQSKAGLGDELSQLAVAVTELHVPR